MLENMSAFFIKINFHLYSHTHAGWMGRMAERNKCFFISKMEIFFSLLFFHPPIRTRMLCFFSIQIHKGVKVCFRNIFSFSLRCLKQRKTNWNPSRNWLILIAMVREKLWADVCWTEGAGIKGWTRSRSKKVFYELQSALIWWANRARATRFYTHDVEHFYSSDLTLSTPIVDRLNAICLWRWWWIDKSGGKFNLREWEPPVRVWNDFIKCQTIFQIKTFRYARAGGPSDLQRDEILPRWKCVSRVTMIWSESSDDPPLHSLSSFGER